MRIFISEHVAFKDKLSEQIFQIIASKLALKLGDSISNNKTSSVKIIFRENKLNLNSITVIIKPDSKFSKTTYKINNGDAMIFAGQTFFDNAKQIFDQFKFKLNAQNQQDMEKIANFAMNAPEFRQAISDIVFNKKRKATTM